MIDFSKTLEQLEDREWADPSTSPYPLVRRCLELVRTPLDKMSAEDCRLLLGQKIGLPFLVPIALNFLYDNPMEGGDMVPGTLLRFVMDLPEEFWRSNSPLWREVKDILFEVETLREQIDVMAPKMKAFEWMNVDE